MTNSISSRNMPLTRVIIPFFANLTVLIVVIGYLILDPAADGFEATASRIAIAVAATM